MNCNRGCIVKTLNINNCYCRYHKNLLLPHSDSEFKRFIDWLLKISAIYTWFYHSYSHSLPSSCCTSFSSYCKVWPLQLVLSYSQPSYQRFRSDDSLLLCSSLYTIVPPMYRQCGYSYSYETVEHHLLHCVTQEGGGKGYFLQIRIQIQFQESEIAHIHLFI